MSISDVTMLLDRQQAEGVWDYGLLVDARRAILSREDSQVLQDHEHRLAAEYGPHGPVALVVRGTDGSPQVYAIKSSRAGRPFDVFWDLTEAEIRILQEVMDDVHGQFIDAVASGRRLDRARVEPLADGRIFSGRQALALGLVDELGDLPDAIERAGAMVGIAGRPQVIQERRRRFSLWDLLTESLGPVLPVGKTATPMVFQYLWR